jgi:AcrR family transcriptional regulator
LYDRSVSSPTGKPPTDRRARRKAQTRERLVVAARAVFARQGIDATRINEITEEADVGFGSFYNYFESKDAIVDAVLEHVLSAAGAAIDAATSDIEDAAEVVAVAHRSLVERAATDPEWGWLLVRLDVTHDIAYSALGPYAARDLARGIDAGRFDVEDRELALIASGGALLGVMRAVLEGRATKAAAVPHAAGVLRMLGMTPADAAEVASRPLPAG